MIENHRKAGCLTALIPPPRWILLLLLQILSFQISESKTMLSKVRAISFDVTGTLLVHKYPIMDTYANAAVWARLANPPSSLELKPAFKDAYKQRLLESPYFGAKEGISNREWWKVTVKVALANTGRKYSEVEIDRFFRRVYSHYGSSDGYELLPDAVPILNWLKSQRKYSLGITTNSPVRTIETVLPMIGIHDYFQWSVCCQDIVAEKPEKLIFDEAFERAKFWTPDLKRDELLHIGDNMAADYCGARAAGFQALLLDRSGNPRVTVYQVMLTSFILVFLMH